MTIITGGLPREAELKHTQNGVPYVKFTIADSRRRRDQAGNWENVDESYIDTTLWGDDAPAVADAIGRGSQVAADGRFVTETWEKDGQKRSKLAFKAWKVYVLVKADHARPAAPVAAGGAGAAGVGTSVPNDSSGAQGAAQPVQASSQDIWGQAPGQYSDAETPF